MMPESRKHSKQKPMVAGTCVMVPFLLIGLTALIYYSNNRSPRIDIPTPTMPNPNAYDDFVRAIKLSKQMQHKSPFSMPKPTYAFSDFQAVEMDAGPTIQAIRQGFGKPFLEPPVRSYKNDNFAQLADFRELARILSGVATYYEIDGQHAKATETRLDGLEMAVTIPRGGQLIVGLVGIACEAIAYSRLESELSLLTEPELAHVAIRLERIASKRVPFADIIQEEGYGEMASDLEMMNDPKGYLNFDTIQSMLVSDPDAAPTMKERFEAVRFAFTNKNAIMLENQKYNRALVEEMRKPFRGPSKVVVPDNLLAQLRSDSTGYARQGFVSWDAVMAIVRTEVALYRYRIKNKRYPVKLNELAPKYITQDVMTDPFSGSMLRYRLQDKGRSFLLYSIGPDLKDDQGTPSKTVGAIPGDIVAGKMRKNRAFKKK